MLDGNFARKAEIKKENKKVLKEIMFTLGCGANRFIGRPGLWCSSDMDIRSAKAR